VTATALSIAGSDPSGGAGIQADLKTFAAHDVYGMAVVSALTAQNTRGVVDVEPVRADFVGAQLGAVLEDLPVGAIKTGMLGTAAVVEAVLTGLEVYDGPVVVDPVVLSSSGHRLLESDAGPALERLVSRATLVTPNLLEAEVLLGPLRPQEWVDRRGTALLITGGHGEGEVVEDRLFLPGLSPRTVSSPRLHTRNSHGTGCTLSAAVAARLARGESLSTAVQGAHAWIHQLLAQSASHALGGGCGPLLHHRGSEG